MAGRLTSLLSVALVLAMVPTAATIAATDADRPLGTLWAPGTATPVTTPRPRAPLDSFDGSAIDAPGAARPSPVGVTDTPSLPAKPLGTLFKGTVPATNTPSSSSPTSAPLPATETLRRRPARSLPQRLPSEVLPPAARPLGRLMAPTPTLPPPQASTTSPAPTLPAPAVTSVAPLKSLATGRNQAKPLGTLFLTTPRIPVPAQETAPTAQQTPEKTAKADPDEDLDTDAGEELDARAGAPPPPASQGEPGEQPVNLTADEMTYDQESKIVTARGRVEVDSQNRKLTADVLTYDQNTDIVTAVGNVVLVETTGEEMFADRMRVTGDLKDGIVHNVGLILTDSSRIVATGGRRSNATVIEMRKGIYSPCNLCEEDPDRPPLWQLKAVRVIHDKGTQTVQYRDAWLEVKGLPVFYTPFFQHPDPTVKRRSGFLTPSFENSEDLGQVFRVPYFWDMGPEKDLTLTPLITTLEASGIIADYRHRFRKGEFNFAGSGVYDFENTTVEPDDDWRGHGRGNVKFHFNDTWRAGIEVDRATDDTYLRRYGFTADSTLTSRGFAEAFKGRNYFAANTYAFQSLDGSVDPDTEPLVLPMLDLNYVGRTGWLGGRPTLDANLLIMERAEGVNMRRLSVRPGWDLPFYDSLGSAYNLSLSLAMDGYHVDELVRPGRTGDFNGFTGRIFPQAKFDWRYPLVRTRGTVDQVIEPIATAIYSLNGGNPNTIPNEDSQELELDDTNLFSGNRFSGLDRVEGGLRAGYGLKWGLYGRGGGSTSLLVGQVFRLRDDDTFGTGTGLTENLSDVVARVHVRPNSHLDMIYRTRFGNDDLSPDRNELSFSGGVPALRVGATYTFVSAQDSGGFAGREELNFSANSRINRFWRADLSGTRDLVENELRSLAVGLTYEDECVIVTTKATRSFFVDRDIEPTDTVFIRLTLKTLGVIQTSASSADN